MRVFRLALIAMGVALAAPAAQAGGFCGFAAKPSLSMAVMLRHCATNEPRLADEDSDACFNRCTNQFQSCSNRCLGKISGRLGDTRANDCEADCRDTYDNCTGSCPSD